MKYLYALKFSQRFTLLLVAFAIYDGWSYKVLEDIKVMAPFINELY